MIWYSARLQMVPAGPGRPRRPRTRHLGPIWDIIPWHRGLLANQQTWENNSKPAAEFSGMKRWRELFIFYTLMLRSRRLKVGPGRGCPHCDPAEFAGAQANQCSPSESSSMSPGKLQRGRLVAVGISLHIEVAAHHQQIVVSIFLIRLSIKYSNYFSIFLHFYNFLFAVFCPLFFIIFIRQNN